ncbi:auxin-induced in root cultures protein 12-like [Diospyros lotus]|uniref:auxin-induced in root cultures protein 12-like n=1 Tax=Diospyros lotus TaxID=55363 RepID=UPI00225A86FC|nr:auxin-induced in root cultures protein 12-like [Diospyros lotus]
MAAPLHVWALFLTLALLLLLQLISPALSLKCTSQSVSSKKNQLYTNCTDLPSLGAYLHWTHDASKSTLYVAFLAPPTKADGWIAWAINPTSTGMAGSQALLAFKQPNGSMAVNTYDISSYSSIVLSKLSFDVSDMSAEYSGGLMKIFATLALPKNATSVNQVWQVGSSVSNGMPTRHEFQSANLNAKGPLDLVKKAAPAAAPAPSSDGPLASPTPAAAPSPATSTSTAGAPTGPDNGGGSMIRSGQLGGFIFAFLASFAVLF